MKNILRSGVCALCAALLPLLPAGCGGGDDDGGDFGDNDKNLVVCIGDSITEGYRCIGDPYPTRLAAMSGKQVKNYGVGGTTSDYGVAVIGGALARQPGYACILYGANDCITGVDLNATVSNLRSIVQACKNNHTKALLATPTPMNGPHVLYDGRATALAEAVRALAKEEGVTCIDLNKAFGDGSEYLNPEDGLHLNDAGGDLIAKKFNSKM